MAHSFIPLSIPHLAGNEEKYLTTCVRDNWVSSVGPYVTQFEEEFAKTVGAKRAIACSSGSSALHLALMALGINAGDLVLVSSMTFIASANTIRYVGAEPIFVDCDRESGHLDLNLIHAFLAEECEMRDGTCIHRDSGRLVSAIMPVHILGHACDMDGLLKLAESYNLKVVEDSAEGLGVKYKSRQVGCFGQAGCFSFNGNKTITAGSGGMVVTDDEALADRVKSLSEQAKQIGIEYIHNEVGYNYRMTNLHAAVGLAQLEQLEHFVKRKKQFAQRYKEAFRDVDGLSWIKPLANVDPAWWLFTITLDEAKLGLSARELMAELKSEKIDSRPLWQPIHLSPAHKGAMSLGGEQASNLYATALSLPSSVGMSDDDQMRVIETILRILKKEN